MACRVEVRISDNNLTSHFGMAVSAPRFANEENVARIQCVQIWTDLPPAG
jgi:stress-induced morphogen